MSEHALHIAPLTVPDQHAPLVLFHGLSSEPILRIYRDGTVEIGAGASLDDASRAFWDVVRIEGQTLRERAERAEARLHALEGN